MQCHIAYLHYITNLIFLNLRVNNSVLKWRAEPSAYCAYLRPRRCSEQTSRWQLLQRLCNRRTDSVFKCLDFLILGRVRWDQSDASNKHFGPHKKVNVIVVYVTVCLLICYISHSRNTKCDILQIYWTYRDSKCVFSMWYVADLMNLGIFYYINYYYWIFINNSLYNYFQIIIETCKLQVLLNFSSSQIWYNCLSLDKWQ